MAKLIYFTAHKFDGTFVRENIFVRNSSYFWNVVCRNYAVVNVLAKRHGFFFSCWTKRFWEYWVVLILEVAYERKKLRNGCSIGFRSLKELYGSQFLTVWAYPG